MIAFLLFTTCVECLSHAATVRHRATVQRLRLGLYSDTLLPVISFRRRRRTRQRLVVELQSSIEDETVSNINYGLRDIDDPNAIFARLLESQLQIVVSSAIADYAAIYIDAGDITNSAPMQLVSCYPPVEEEVDDEVVLSETELLNESRYSIWYRDSAMGVLQLLRSDGSKPSSQSHVGEAVAKSIGMSIGMEMARQSLLDEFRGAIQSIRGIESDAWLRSSSALLTSRTLLKMVANRLPKDDDIGREMVENVLEQAESIGHALSLLSHDADDEGEDQHDGEVYYDAVDDSQISSSGAVIDVIDVSVVGGSSGNDATYAEDGGQTISQPNTHRIDQDTARRRLLHDSSANGSNSNSSSSSSSSIDDEFWLVSKDEIAVDYPTGEHE